MQCNDIIYIFIYTPCRDIYFFVGALAQSVTHAVVDIFFIIHKFSVNFCSRHIFEYLFDGIKADFYFRYFYRLNLISHICVYLLEQIFICWILHSFIFGFLLSIVIDNDSNKNLSALLIDSNWVSGIGDEKFLRK